VDKSPFSVLELELSFFPSRVNRDRGPEGDPHGLQSSVVQLVHLKPKNLVAGRAHHRSHVEAFRGSGKKQLAIPAEALKLWKGTLAASDEPLLLIEAGDSPRVQSEQIPIFVHVPCESHRLFRSADAQVLMSLLRGKYVNPIRTVSG
jgi:hypothetical protein